MITCKRSLLIGAGILFIAGGHLAAADEPLKKPNFLFILADDQRWDALGVVQKEQGEKARFPWIKTPNLDRLASEGVRFRNAFVTTSLCSPSRACFLTGRYNHLNGVGNNEVPFPVGNVTYATLLRQAGYATAYFGKWHMTNQEERPGFNEIASFVGQGTYFNTRFLVNGQPVVTKDGEWVDDVTTDYAIDFLRKNRETPFVAVVGFKSPHDPREPAATEKDLYPDEVPRSVPSLDVPTPYREPSAHGPSDENLRRYFRCISGIDRNVGRLLDEMNKLGLDKNTVVVFASDNGYFAGEHRLGDKRAAYEESLRIPLLVRAPGIAAGTTREETALNIDLAPTFLDFAGLPAPEEMQGRSFRPLLESKPASNWRTAFLYEYFFERSQTKTPTILAVRRDDAILTTYPGHPDWTEVFDLRTDPYEIRNLASSAGHTNLREDLSSELDRQKAATAFVIPTYVEPDRFVIPAPAVPGPEPVSPPDPGN